MLVQRYGKLAEPRVRMRVVLNLDVDEEEGRDVAEGRLLAVSYRPGTSVRWQTGTLRNTPPQDLNQRLQDK
jgi:hypothetical protein